MLSYVILNVESHLLDCGVLCVFFFKQKTAYEMRISDWSSDVCSSDLVPVRSPHVRLTLAPDGIDILALGVYRRSPQESAESRSGFDQTAGQYAEAIHPYASAPTSGLSGSLYSRFEASASSAKLGSASCRARVCQYV